MLHILIPPWYDRETARLEEITDFGPMPFVFFRLADCFFDCFLCSGVCVFDVGVGVGEELCRFAGVGVETGVWGNLIIRPRLLRRHPLYLRGGAGWYGCGGVVGGCE